MNNNELDIDILEDYLDGKLDAKTMHRVERLSLEDPFVAEALAGLSLLPKRTQSLSLLQKQLQQRIAQKPVEVKRWQITSQRLSIAAAAAVLFITVSLLFWMRESSNRAKTASNASKKVEVAIAANKIPETPIVKTKEEVEKIIIDADKTSYANNSRKIVGKPVKSSTVVPTAAPSASLENADESVSLRSINIKGKKEVASKQLPSALSGKVAGLRINGNLIKGVVYGDDKLPIEGASVKLKGASQGVTTDKNGQFSLVVDSLLKRSALQVTYLGFIPKEVDFKNNEKLSIELKPDGAALNEVVVTSSTTIVKSAEPLGGWDKFEEYAVTNNRLLIDKKLTGRDIILRFKISKEGRPVNIKIAKNTNLTPKQTKAEENEAIRLLKDGPKWTNPTSSAEASVMIRF